MEILRHTIDEINNSIVQGTVQEKKNTCYEENANYTPGLSIELDQSSLARWKLEGYPQLPASEKIGLA